MIWPVAQATGSVDGGGGWPADRSGGRPGWFQTRDPHEVVRGGDEVPSQLGAGQPAVARSSEAADRLQPAKHFLDALADALAGGVARMPSGARIDRAAPTTGVLRHVWRDLLLANGRN